MNKGDDILDITKDPSQFREDEIESLQVQINKLICDKNDVKAEYIAKMTELENIIDILCTAQQKLKNQR
jgi:hypothetical protein